MQVPEYLLLGARIIVAGGIGYLFALGVASLVTPDAARRFLSGFASTPALNLLEATLRALIGAGFMLAADDFPWPDLWFWSGAFLVISAVAMLFLFPLHQRYAQLVVPPVLRHVRLYGLMSLALGAAVLAAWVL